MRGNVFFLLFFLCFKANASMNLWSREGTNVGECNDTQSEGNTTEKKLNFIDVKDKFVLLFITAAKLSTKVGTIITTIMTNIFTIKNCLYYYWYILLLSSLLLTIIDAIVLSIIPRIYNILVFALYFFFSLFNSHSPRFLLAFGYCPLPDFVVTSCKIPKCVQFFLILTIENGRAIL